MRVVDYVDARGRWKRALLPEGAPDSDAPIGIQIGPPDVVDDLGLPEPLATRLHNLLHKRGLYSSKEVMKQPNSLLSALQKALSVDVHKLMVAYDKSGIETYVNDDDK